MTYWTPKALRGVGAGFVLATAAACITPNPGSNQEVTRGAAAAENCTPRETPVYALGGTILTPDGPVQGYLVVAGELIEAIATSRDAIPEGATVVETGGIVSPGLIDLHNHVAYNFLPRWDAGRTFSNRFEWSGTGEEGQEGYVPEDPGYAPNVKEPYAAVKNAGHMCEAVKWGEFRAIVGGTTTIQGSANLKCTRGWARNLEFKNFCGDYVGQAGGSLSFFEPDEVSRVLASFEDGSTRAYIMHLAEGIDELSRHEFDQLRDIGMVQPQVVIIHGTALTGTEFEEMGRVGMKLVWSPTSNLQLYGRTTDIPAALNAGVMVSLAPDWTPSGTANVLAEMKVADRVDSETFGDVIDDQAMFRMVTSNPADSSGLAEHIGRIAPGLYADIVVIRGDVEHPYRALVDARPADVLGTFVSGEILYGEPRLLDALGKAGQYERLPAEVACGEERGFDVTVDDHDVPGGTETLGEVSGLLSTDIGHPILPLFDCGDASAETAAE